MAIREKKSVGPQGLADVRILKDTVRIHFADGDVYDFPKEALNKDIQQGKYIVTLSANKDKIFGLKAPAGQYIWQFKQIGNRTKTATGPGLPSSKIQRGGPRSFGDKHWIAPDELVWIAELEIVPGFQANGIYGGLVTTTNLPYSFSKPSAGSLDFVDTKRNLKRLEDFFRAAAGMTLVDIDNGGVLKYSDDSTKMLLDIEKLLLEDPRPFLGNSNEKGFIDLNTISPVPVDLLPKRTAKKASKK